MTVRRTILLCLASGLCGALAVTSLHVLPDSASTSAAQEPAPATLVRVRPLDPAQLEALTPEERVNIGVYQKTNRGVVNINTKSVRTDSFFMFEVPTEGAGSGIVLDRQGHIVTNFHVIEDARQIQVTLFDGKSYEAQVVGLDRNTDVAVLKIDAPAECLHPVTLGDSSKLLVGQRVYAIGNPFGLERTLTTGIISSLNRQLPSPRLHRRMEQMIQIDAALNPGNSGGPLLDTGGRMIGMNQAIASKTQENTGVGFAIPINTIARIVPQLIEKGHVVRADIGIARVYQVDEGLLVAQLSPGGAAERAGIRGPKVHHIERRQGPYIWQQTVLDRSAADLIVGVEGKRVHDVEEFIGLIESRRPGDTVQLNVIREGKPVNVPVVLDADE